MTNEEARDQIVIFMCILQKVINDRDKQALEMAIQALEQSSGDAVSRQAVNEIINDIRDCISVEGYCAILERLKKLPSVTQKSETVTEFADRCRECGAKYGKLLNQEPCEDAISRQAVDVLVDELARAISDERCCISRGRSTATIMQNILDLPSVKPQEPKTGHWIKYGKLYQCSECEELSCCQGKFCNECGAKMVEEQESDHKCHTCKHYTSGEHDGSCGSYICKGYSDWESEVEE